jgi:hypothetical protein
VADGRSVDFVFVVDAALSKTFPFPILWTYILPNTYTSLHLDKNACFKTLGHIQAPGLSFVVLTVTPCICPPLFGPSDGPGSEMRASL